MYKVEGEKDEECEYTPNEALTPLYHVMNA
jgi:hypothetical protein